MKTQRLAVLLLIGLVWPCSPVTAQEYGLQATLKKMTDLLAEQQKQLDEQAKELAEQRELIRQLQAGQGTAPPAAAPVPAAEPVAPPPDAATAQVADASAETEAEASGEDQSAQDQAKEALAKQQEQEQVEGPKTETDILADLQKSMDDPSSTLYDADFPGAWYLPGTTAAMRIGGYVNLSFVNNFDPMLIQDRFIVGSIPPDDQIVPGAVEGTSVSADQTRINLEYREQTSQGEVRAFVEGDFRGNDSNFRLRHAFGQFHSVLAGKTWSTLMDTESRPEEVDIEGINGQVLVRHSQVRWSPQFGEKARLKIALEDPETDVINGSSDRGFADIVASADRIPSGPFGHGWNWRVGAVLRNLKATGMSPNGIMGDDFVSPASDTTIGWGITTGGRQPVKWWGGKDFFLWQLTYGEGIGHYINDLDTIGSGDAVFDPQGKLHALPVFAGYLSYQHIWPMTWRFVESWPGVMRSSVNLSWVDIDNFDFQDGSDYKRTLRASANLIYSPTTSVTLGLELLWGERKNKDNSKGTASQFQFSARYSF
jgi:hypothetical protein